jgi:hypothetical protein
LCNGLANVAWKPDVAVWTVDCACCSRYTIDEYLMNVIRQGRAQQDDRVCRLLPLLSAATHDAWQDGERLDLAGENWQAIAHDAREKGRRA